MSEVRKIQIQDGKGNVYHPQTVSEQVLDLDKRLEGLAKETYVDEKIAAIPEVDLSDIKNNISTLEEKKADKEEIPKYGNDLKVSEGWEVPLGSVVEGLNNFKADKTELDNKADKAELIGLATEKYVDDKISEIPEVDLTNIENDISSLKTNKADKSELTNVKDELTEAKEDIENIRERSPKPINWDNVQRMEVRRTIEIDGPGRLIKTNIGVNDSEYFLELYEIDGRQDPYGEAFYDNYVGGESGQFDIIYLDWNKSVTFTCDNYVNNSFIWVEML